ncbi:long-chain acyl-CoA synthetase [Caldimonas brevitalea]|uniref:Long-chain acyl-CoA synthetase n=1 Tax=Caldimonas brevitalea TaxID=413882 RepID=A0A0G3BM11_9BURK|nr:long-chain acyl-CoA synthetase [Caldimonas brevitalea]
MKMPEVRQFELLDGLTSRRSTAAELGGLAKWFQNRFATKTRPVVALIIDDKFELIRVTLALTQLAVNVIPLNPSASENELEPYLRHAEVSFIVTDAPALMVGHDCAILSTNELPTDLPAAEPASAEHVQAAFVFFTSGSTGVPKGVRLEPAMVVGNARLAIQHLPYTADTVTASILPGYHTFTLISDVMTSFILATKCVVLPNFELKYLSSTVDALIQHRVNTFSAVPIIFNVLSKFAGALRESALQFTTSGAAPLTAELARQYTENLGHPLVPCYGMTEAVCFITISDIRQIKFGSAGKPVVELRVVDEGDIPLPSHTVGAIQVRGDTVIADGYYRSNLEHTQVYAEGGWLRTGDLGYLDEDGCLFVRGRSKNMVIRGGEKIYLEDVEALFESGTVAGVPILRDNSEAYALFIEEGRHDPEHAVHTIRGALGERHVPDQVIMIPRVPKSPTGKLLRQEIAKELARGHR